MGNDRATESQHNIFYNAQRQVTLNLKPRSVLNSNTEYYASPAYLQVLKRSEVKLLRKPGETIFKTLSISNDGIRSKFKLIQAFLYVLVTYKYEEDQIKNVGARVAMTFRTLKVYGDVSSRSMAAYTIVLR